MKKTQLEKLKTRKLAWPKGIESFILMNMNSQKAIKEAQKRSYFVDTLEMFEGKLLRRVFGYQFFKTNKHGLELKIMEAARYLEGEKLFLLGNVYCNMNGKTCEYDSENCFGTYDGKWNFFPEHMYREEEWIKKLDIPYCQYLSGMNNSGLDFFNYVCIYRKEPKIELLVKAGYSHYITGLRYLDLKQKSLEKIFKIDSKHVPYLQKMECSELLLCRKYPWASLVQIRNIAFIKKKYIRKYLDPRVYDYVMRFCMQSMDIYDDYLNYAEQIGMDMTSRRTLMPDNLIEAHNTAYKEVTDIKDKLVDEGILKNYEKHKKLIYSNDAYVIRPAKNNAELKAESLALKHCVRTYAIKVSKMKTEILFVRSIEKPDIPLYTLELQGKELIQFRGEYNTNPSKSAFDFIHEWASKNKLNDTVMMERRMV